MFCYQSFWPTFHQPNWGYSHIQNIFANVQCLFHRHFRNHSILDMEGYSGNNCIMLDDICILLDDIPVRVMKLTICIMTCRIAWWHLHSACWHSNPVKSFYNYNITNFTLCLMTFVFCLMTFPFGLWNLQYALWHVVLHDGICILHVDIPILLRAITITTLLTSLCLNACEHHLMNASFVTIYITSLFLS